LRKKLVMAAAVVAVVSHGWRLAVDRLKLLNL
jgi:hypothetical protein